MSHEPGGPVDHDHDKHLQLGTILADDDRAEMTPGEVDAAWAEATTVDQFRADIETLRAAGWPEGSS